MTDIDDLRALLICQWRADGVRRQAAWRRVMQWLGRWIAGRRVR